MSMLSGSGARIQKEKAQILNFTQAAAVQNIWYTALNTNNASLTVLAIGVTVANETLELRITVDDVVWLGSVDITAAQWSRPDGYVVSATPPTLQMAITAASSAGNVYDNYPAFFSGRNVKIEVRKTTATGASALRAVGVYTAIP